ncbi:hypothetical protein J6590_044798 [Homalodisca vitripennis]|nr:hypothetical protein J6590_044798 [Homalodisca vitripennis]
MHVRRAAGVQKGEGFPEYKISKHTRGSLASPRPSRHESPLPTSPAVTTTRRSHPGKVCGPTHFRIEHRRRDSTHSPRLRPVTDRYRRFSPLAHGPRNVKCVSGACYSCGKLENNSLFTKQYSEDRHWPHFGPWSRTDRVGAKRGTGVVTPAGVIIVCTHIASVIRQDKISTNNIYLILPRGLHFIGMPHGISFAVKCWWLSPVTQTARRPNLKLSDPTLYRTPSPLPALIPRGLHFIGMPHGISFAVKCWWLSPVTQTARRPNLKLSDPTLYRTLSPLPALIPRGLHFIGMPHGISFAVKCWWLSPVTQTARRPNLKLSDPTLYRPRLPYLH